MVGSKTPGSRIADGLIIAVLIGIALTAFLPIIHVAAVSFSDKAAAIANYVVLWPVGFSLAPYEYILEDPSFFRAFGVSLERVTLGGAINFLMTILMAFPLSRGVKKFPARNVFMWIVLLAMLFHAGLVPWYMTIRYLKIRDSIWALVLPGAVPIWNVILLMNFFRNIPKELDEAAAMDGAGPWTMLFRIYLPVSTPALATVTLFSLVGHWNAWFDGLILMDKVRHYPLMTYIQQLMVAVRLETLTETDLSREVLERLTDVTLNAAKLVVSIVPVLVVYPFLQRYFIHGIMLGAIKE